jgi:hypothetical protein
MASKRLSEDGKAAVVAANKARIKHGHCSEKKSGEYLAWQGMVQRCHRPKNKGFHRYGKRGIYVADEWRADFVAFISYIGPRPSPKHSIDRKDNNGHYVPGNVRWATKQEQARNRSDNVHVVIDGKEMLLVEASEQFNIPAKIIRDRIKDGWSAIDAVSIPKLAIR